MSSATIGLREILDAPVHFLRENFKPLVSIAVVGEAVAVIPIIIYQLVAGGQTPDLTVPSEFGVYMALTYSAVGTQWLIRLLPALALYYAVKQLLDGEGAPSVGAAYQAATTPRIYFTYVLQGMIILLGFTVGSICCGAPGIAAAVLFSLLAPVMFHEGRGWMDALGRSYDLVWTNPSKKFVGSTVFAALIAGTVYFGVSMAINTMAALPSTIWTATEMFANAAAGASPTALSVPIWLVLVGAVLGVCAQSVVSLYPAVAFTMLYREVIRRRDGDDLAAAIQERLDG